MSINSFCHSEEHPKGTCFAPRTPCKARLCATFDLIRGGLCPLELPLRKRNADHIERVYRQAASPPFGGLTRCGQTSFICCIQSMHMIRTAFVALTLLPQHGHISFLVLLGLRSPPAFAAPAWLVPAAPKRTPGITLLRPMRISFHPFESAYSARFSPGVVFYPY